MHNYFAIETEAKFRQEEWERAMVADARAAQAVAVPRQRGLNHVPRLSLTNLRQMTAPRLSIAAPLAAGGGAGAAHLVECES
jgi:hypothetical protein